MQFEVWGKETASSTAFYSILINAMSRHQAHQQAADAPQGTNVKLSPEFRTVHIYRLYTVCLITTIR